MKILFLATAFNGMAQRAWIELDRLNHQVKVQIASGAEAMLQAVEAFQPELIIAPFLKTKIPEHIWKNHLCLVIHPGVPGDRGAASLDWAILNRKPEWGVTILQAAEKMDAGAIWASGAFPMREASKACLYRHEVTQTAMTCLLKAVENVQTPGFQPAPLDYSDPLVTGTWNRSTQQADYQFSWTDDPADILRKLRAADSDPGVLLQLGNMEFFAFGGHPEEQLRGAPGQIIAQRAKAISIGAGSKALWITHLKAHEPGAVKLPALLALGAGAEQIPADECSPFAVTTAATFREIRYEERGDVGYLQFDYYNGDMDTDQ